MALLKLFFLAGLAAVFLFILWGPTLFVAKRLRRDGHATAFRHLRFIWPCQLIAALMLVMVADEFGLTNPAGVLVAATVGVSAAGAAAYALLGLALRIRIR